jgi:hypothetical protein
MYDSRVATCRAGGVKSVSVDQEKRNNGCRELERSAYCHNLYLTHNSLGLGASSISTG